MGKVMKIAIKNSQGQRTGWESIPYVNGTTFTPSVDSSGNISWINDGGLVNPTTVNIKGPEGDDGLTPFIGQNGNWWIGTTDTGVNASGGNVPDASENTKGITKVTSTITSGSASAVTSGAVYTAIGNVESILNTLNSGNGVSS